MDILKKKKDTDKERPDPGIQKPHVSSLEGPFPIDKPLNPANPIPVPKDPTRADK